MNDAENDLPPPARLAVAHAPRHMRSAFALLLRFDARFADVVGQISEPLIGQMKLAWWRDAIGADRCLRPQGEPLLSALFELDNPDVDEAVIGLINAWETLIVEENWSAAAVERFADMRGQAAFGAYAKLARCPGFPAPVARQWAVDDLRLHFDGRVADIERGDEVIPNSRSFRPMTILAMSVRQVSGPRLVWHALTGR